MRQVMLRLPFQSTVASSFPHSASCAAHNKFIQFRGWRAFKRKRVNTVSGSPQPRPAHCPCHTLLWYVPIGDPFATRLPRYHGSLLPIDERMYLFISNPQLCERIGDLSPRPSLTHAYPEMGQEAFRIHGTYDQWPSRRQKLIPPKPPRQRWQARFTDQEHMSRDRGESECLNDSDAFSCLCCNRRTFLSGPSVTPRH